jgi:hypothetical protein
MAQPITQAARDRLREQARREQELANRVLHAESRLTAEQAKRAATLATHDSVISQRADEVADALIDYLEQAGVGLERAAVIFGRSRSELARMVRNRRRARRRSAGRGSERA